MFETLLEGVGRGEVASVSAGVNHLTEAERRQFAPKALKLFRDVRDAYIGRLQEKSWPYAGDQRSVLNAAQVLAMGTASSAELRKLAPWAMPPNDLAFDTLRHRPAVIESLVEVIADDVPRRWNSQFKLMRSLVRAGHIQRPTNTGYILAMIHGLESRDVTIYDALGADPELLEDEVWRLFEVEGGGETSLATHDKYSPEAENWSVALKRLSADGQLPRSRLLDASLAALRRDFAPFRAGWFSRFHELLNPTREERRQREADYAALLSSPVPATVSFAARALVEAGGISDAKADRLNAALVSRVTATVKAAIKLLPKSERGATLAAEALPHATRDGQVALLAFIERVGHADPRVAGLVSAAGPSLAPGLRGRSEVVGSRATTDALSPANEVASSAKAAGPVESVPELVELLATLLEHIEDAHEIERALDGASRFCDRTEATIRRLEPVARRAQKLLSGAEFEPFAGVSPRGDVAGLILAWSSGKKPNSRPRRSVLGFLSSRVFEVAVRAARGKRQPMLSLPTDRGGAIDPDVLAVRRAELKRLRVKASEADSIQAALRAGEIRLKESARFAFGATSSSHTYQDKTYRHVYFHLNVVPPPKGDPKLLDVPGLLLAAIPWETARRSEVDYARSGLAEAIRWVSIVWPAYREPFYAKGASELGQNIDWMEARWYVRCFLEPLLIPTEPIGDMGRLLVALGLAAKESGERALATDVFIAAIGQGRLDPEDLGNTLGALYDQQLVKGSRLATAMSGVSGVSNRHAAAVAETLERVLAALHGPPPADLHAVLDVLSDVLAMIGRPLGDPDASAYLSGIEGTGKAAVTAHRLLGGASPEQRATGSPGDARTMSPGVT